jgi:hypothetical protein
MNTRRKFLLQGSMATTAMLVARPFETLANTLSPVTGFTVNSNKIVLAHTGNNFGANLHVTLNHIAELKSNTNNLVMLHAGNATAGLSTHKPFDAMMKDEHSFSSTSVDHKIIYKGNIKIGIISACAGESNLVEKINTLSGWLKKEKGCQLVACMSDLGYKQKEGMDDVRLAESSADLDIIIGGHAENFSKHPVTTLNKHKEEVIINHAAGNELALRKIEIEFSETGKKKHVAFTRSVPLSKGAKIA